MVDSNRKNRAGLASANPRRATHTSTDGDYDRPKPGSIADVVGRLEMWGRLAPTGLARIAFTSEYARQRVVEELRTAFKAAAVPFHEIDLAPNTPADEIVRLLKARYRTLEPGVVSLSGLTAALPFDHTDLLTALHVLNFNRENLAVHPLRQIWWMSKTLADEFTRTVPDINSWFIVKETLTETVPPPVDAYGEIFRPQKASINIDQARAQAEYLTARFHAALEADAPLEDLRWLASASVAALREGAAEAEVRALAQRLEEEVNRVVVNNRGDRAVVAGGSITDAIIIPGNNNIVIMGRADSDRRPNSDAASNSVFFVPHGRNPFFTGRDKVLTRLRKALVTNGRTGLVQAITGMGGVGKTQTAVEYCYRHYHDSRDYDVVLWAQADSTATLLASYERIATGLALDLPPTATSEEVRDAVKRWLEEPTAGSRYLLVLDNADEPAVARDFVSKNPAGHILITSRNHNLSILGVPDTTLLPIMDEEAAIAFLLERGKRKTAADTERDAAAMLAEELGYLPLALEQAAAYVDDKESRYDTYLHSFRERRLGLLNRQRTVFGDYQETVATTWSLSIEEVREKSPAAADILTASAFLAPDRIPEEIFTRGALELGPALTNALHNAQRDPALFDELLSHLTRYSLISRDRDNRSFDVHRLVQEVIQESPATEKRVWVERIASALRYVDPGKEFAGWPACERLLPHWLVCAELTERMNIESADTASMLNRAGFYLNYRARYEEAEPLYVRALAMREKVLGSNHPDTATSLGNLANLYKDQGRYTEAERLHLRSLAIREKVRGPDHLDTAFSLNNLANLYYDQGRYGEAEPLHVRALTIREQALGSDHPDTASSMNNLARLYNRLGRYREAEPLCIRALETREKALGPDDPDTASSLNNMGRLRSGQGRYTEAEPLIARALAIREQVFGLNHPRTVLTIENYADLLDKTGRHEEATAMRQRAAHRAENGK